VTLPPSEPSGDAGISSEPVPVQPETGQSESGLLPADPFAEPDVAERVETGEFVVGEITEPDESPDRLPAGAVESGEKMGATRSFLRELPILILVALVVAVLIKTFLVQAFYIPSGSMEETLLVGDRVMVNKLAYRFGDPSAGDVIVFDSPLEGDERESIFGAVVRHVAESLGLSSPDSALIKRVIAVEGETIEIRGNQVLINGEPLDESYIPDDGRMRNFGPVTVPESHVFVMGDNRHPGMSTDSRSFGSISESDIIGKAFIRVWPPSRWGGL